MPQWWETVVNEGAASFSICLENKPQHQGGDAEPAVGGEIQEEAAEEGTGQAAGSNLPEDQARSGVTAQAPLQKY